MNRKLPQQVIDKALSEDSYKASAEYLGRWREDLSDFVPLDVIEACTEFNVRERPPQPNVQHLAYCDPAGGTGSDSFTLAIAHREPDSIGTVHLDLLRERKPRFVPADVVREFADVLKSYKISEIQGDKFAGGFHSDEWARNNITFKACENTTSENYLHALPMLLNGRARLLDNAALRGQLASLERRVTPASREIVSHPQVASAHDDLATAACGALVAAGDRLGYNSAYATWIEGAGNNRDDAAAWQRMRTAFYIGSGGRIRLW
jgi:hypothetical protein